MGCCWPRLTPPPRPTPPPQPNPVEGEGEGNDKGKGKGKGKGRGRRPDCYLSNAELAEVRLERRQWRRWQ